MLIVSAVNIPNINESLRSYANTNIDHKPNI